MYELDQPFTVQIVPHGETRVFTLAEARALLPLVRKLTLAASEQLQPVRAQLQGMMPVDPALPEYEQRYREIVEAWLAKLGRLGVSASGLWVVHFDTGDGYLCWRHPELELSHYHAYEACQEQRERIGAFIERCHPDWA